MRNVSFIWPFLKSKHVQTLSLPKLKWVINNTLSINSWVYLVFLYPVSVYPKTSERYFPCPSEQHSYTLSCCSWSFTACSFSLRAWWPLNEAWILVAALHSSVNKENNILVFFFICTVEYRSLKKGPGNYIGCHIVN